MENRSPKTSPERRRRVRSNRFIARYHARRAQNQHALIRPVRITAGLLLIAGGIVIGWLPGPGFVILALPGAFLLASEVHGAALQLDRLENVTIPHLKRLYARHRGGPKLEWVERDPDEWADWSEKTGRQLRADVEPRSTAVDVDDDVPTISR